MDTKAAGPIDVHAHMVVREVEELIAGHPKGSAAIRTFADRQGGASAAVTQAMMAERFERLVSVERHLADMESAGVQAQVLSGVQFNYWAERQLAREIYLATHEGLSNYCAAAPGRFSGLGTVPLQHPDLCIDALEDAVLKHGFKGVSIASHVEPADGGRPVELSAPGLEDFWRRCVELEAVVFLHPLGCTIDHRLDQWYLANSVGQPLEHAIALAHLVFSGVLDRHRGLRLIAAHGGGYFTSQLGRLDHAWKHRSDARTPERLPSSYLRDIFVDSCVHSPHVLRGLVEQMGSDRILMGSDQPFDMGSEQPLADLNSAGLQPADVEAIATLNAVELGLHPRVPQPGTSSAELADLAVSAPQYAKEGKTDHE